MYTHRIIHIGAGTAPSELRFESEEAAKRWLEGFPVNQQYKDQNYRIVPIGEYAERAVRIQTLEYTSFWQKGNDVYRLNEYEPVQFDTYGLPLGARWECTVRHWNAFKFGPVLEHLRPQAQPESQGPQHGSQIAEEDQNRKAGAILKLVLHFTGELPQRVTVETFEQASQVFAAHRDAGDYGGSDMKARCGLLIKDGKPFAHVSYNGRVWPGKPQDWTIGTEPVYDPIPGTTYRNKLDAHTPCERMLRIQPACPTCQNNHDPAIQCRYA